MREHLARLSVFVPGHLLASGVQRGAHGAYSNVACLNPAAAQRWTDQMKTDLPGALEVEQRLRQFMGGYIAPFITEQKYCNAACDRFMARLGGWADVGETMRWPYRSIPVAETQRIRPVAQRLSPSSSNLERNIHDFPRARHRRAEFRAAGPPAGQRLRSGTACKRIGFRKGCPPASPPLTTSAGTSKPCSLTRRRGSTWRFSRAPMGSSRLRIAPATRWKADGRSGTLDFQDHKTKTRDDWENVTKPRMVLDDPSGTARIDSASYFCHFDPYPTWAEAKEKFDAIYARGRFVTFAAYGPWEATWRHHAMDELLLDVLEDPEWCADMFATYTNLLLAVLQRSLDHGMKPDGLFLVEDMGFKTSLLISPKTWDALLRPCYERINALLRRHGIRFLMHTDGRMWDLLPRLIEVGVEALNPFECAAGMDIAELRRRYPRQLTCYGNLSATGLLGDRAALDAELQRKIPFATGGGFIMHSDHSIPFGVSYEQYRWACQRAQEIFAATRQAGS